jgi:hypothetical protein
MLNTRHYYSIRARSNDCAYEQPIMKKHEFTESILHDTVMLHTTLSSSGGEDSTLCVMDKTALVDENGKQK